MPSSLRSRARITRAPAALPTSSCTVPDSEPVAVPNTSVNSAPTCAAHLVEIQERRRPSPLVPQPQGLHVHGAVPRKHRTMYLPACTFSSLNVSSAPTGCGRPSWPNRWLTSSQVYRPWRRRLSSLRRIQLQLSGDVRIGNQAQFDVEPTFDPATSISISGVPTREPQRVSSPPGASQPAPSLYLPGSNPQNSNDPSGLNGFPWPPSRQETKANACGAPRGMHSATLPLTLTKGNTDLR